MVEMDTRINKDTYKNPSPVMTIKALAIPVQY